MPFWFDRFDYSIQQIREPHRIELQGELFEFLPDDRANQESVFVRLRKKAKETFDSDIDFNEFFEAQCHSLEGIAGYSLSDFQSTDIWSAILSREDIRTLSASGSAIIGSHTVDHVQLAKVEAEECTRQLSESKSQLEEITQERCDNFCYPNGNASAKVANLVKESGYQSAVTMAPGLNPVGTDRYLLNRIHLPDHSDAARLEALLSGFELAAGKLRAIFRR